MSSLPVQPLFPSLDMSSSIGRIWRHTLARYSPFTVEFFGTLLVQLFFFWIPSGIYLSLDTLFPKFSARHKIQPPPKQPTKAEVWDCLNVVLRNQLLSTVLHSIFIHLSARYGKTSYRLDPSLPSLREMITHVILSLLIREVMFYYSHRLLHHPKLYPKIHKLHHRFTAPVALAAQYSHPFEQIVANILPISLPPQLLGAHILTFWVFMAFELLETTTVHSGYNFFHNLAKKHDLHHEKFLIYFGTFGGLDWLHGTDGSRARKRGKGVVAAKGVSKEQQQVVLDNKEE